MRYKNCHETHGRPRKKSITHAKQRARHSRAGGNPVLNKPPLQKDIKKDNLPRHHTEGHGNSMMQAEQLSRHSRGGGNPVVSKLPVQKDIKKDNLPRNHTKGHGKNDCFSFDSDWLCGNFSYLLY
jgi:hypothetical protein